VRRLLFAACLAVMAGACDLGREAVETDAASASIDATPPINGDLVPPVGSATTLDIACWNLEWFPKDSHTITMVADLITSLELDVVIVEEVASVAAWDELVARLPLHEGVLSTHRYTPTEYQKIGFSTAPIWSPWASPSCCSPARASTSCGADEAAPTAAASASTPSGCTKAGTAPEDAGAPRPAMVTLERYVRAQVDGGGEDEVVVLGDYNEVLTTASGQAVMAPMLSAPDRYRFRSQRPPPPARLASSPAARSSITS
jgi:hypothetical protein